MTLPDVTVVDSLATVASAFDDDPSPRVLAVLSPTHPACLLGVGALGRALDHCERDVRLLLVWTPVLGGDDRDQLAKATLHLPDARNFLDEERLVGRAVAEAVCGADAVAWDTYLFYGGDASWDDLADPSAWYHGLADCEWAPAGHYYGGDREAALQGALSSLGSAQPS